jgi:hypothetical protein
MSARFRISGLTVLLIPLGLAADGVEGQLAVARRRVAHHHLGRVALALDGRHEGRDHLCARDQQRAQLSERGKWLGKLGEETSDTQRGQSQRQSATSSQSANSNQQLVSK